MDDPIVKTLLWTAAIGMLSYLLKGMVGGLIKLLRSKLDEMAARRQAFLSHIELCNEKGKAFALLEQRVCILEDHNTTDRATREWIGDCVVKIATKMDVELDPRPRS